MTVLLVGVLLFLGMHSISIFACQWRDTTAARIGEGVWKGLYSVISLAGIALIVVGYGLARQEPVVLYLPPAWLRHIGLLLLLFVFPLLLAAYLPGRIQAKLKHPMLLAVKIWALAHLLMNGMLADVVLFGAFLGWAVVDRISLKRRRARSLPISACVSAWNDAIAVGLGIVIYLAFVLDLHQRLIGVAVVP